MTKFLGGSVGVQLECGIHGPLLLVPVWWSHSRHYVELFLGGCWTHQGPLLSLILVVVFLDRIWRCSRGQQCFRIGSLSFRSLLFAEDVVLLVSDLQHTLERFPTQCEAAGLNISTSKYKAGKRWVFRSVVLQEQERLATEQKAWITQRHLEHLKHLKTPGTPRATGDTGSIWRHTETPGTLAHPAEPAALEQGRTEEEVDDGQMMSPRSSSG